jgi:biopolymer transport protein ExbB
MKLGAGDPSGSGSILSWLIPADPTQLARRVSWVVMLLACTVMVLGMRGLSLSPAVAQAPSETLEDPGTKPAKPAAKAGPPQGKQATTVVEFILQSGLIGFLIILLSFVMVALIVEHGLTIRKEVLMPEAVMQQLEEKVATGKLDDAIAFCQQPPNFSLATDVVLAGLERFKGSQFGFAEYKAAVEEAGEEATSALYRKTEVLGVIGAIAPMLGLLGTVQGMILAFDTLATSGGAADPAKLADSIGLALVTTFEGLVVAIPAMIAYSFFRNLIDSLIAEAGKRVERILAPLGQQKK